MKLAPHLHRIGNDIVAAYLVDTDEGVTVIDAGLAGHWHELLAELAGMGRSVDDIRGRRSSPTATATTSGSPNGSGATTACPVYVHEADAARARGEVKPKVQWGRMKLGADGRLLLVRDAQGRAAHHVPHRGRRRSTTARCSTCRAHRASSACPGTRRAASPSTFPLADAVFVGDALTTRHVLTGQRGPQPAPFTDDPAQALASLHRLDGLEATWVLPGHGTPWTGGVAEAVRAIRTVASP